MQICIWHIQLHLHMHQDNGQKNPAYFFSMTVKEYLRGKVSALAVFAADVGTYDEDEHFVFEQ